MEQTAYPLLRDTEVAKILNIGLSTLRAMRTDGIGPRWVRVSANRIRYRPEDIEVYLRQCPSGGQRGAA